MPQNLVKRTPIIGFHMENNPFIIQPQEVLVADRGAAVRAVDGTAEKLFCIRYRKQDRCPVRACNKQEIPTMGFPAVSADTAADIQGVPVVALRC